MVLEGCSDHDGGIVFGCSKLSRLDRKTIEIGACFEERGVYGLPPRTKLAHESTVIEHEPRVVGRIC